jgi:hypothetical protein
VGQEDLVQFTYLLKLILEELGFSEFFRATLKNLSFEQKWSISFWAEEEESGLNRDSNRI